MADETKTLDPLELLLRGDQPDFRKSLPTKRVELPRLSELAGEPVIFTLRGLTFSDVAALKGAKDAALKGVLLGCETPSFRDRRLLDPKAGLAEPYDVIRARLLPGEIDELWAHIQILSGYLRRVTAEVKNA